MLGMSDPRVVGVLRAAPRVGRFLVRGRRRTASAGEDDSIVPIRLTPALALQAYLDEVLIALFRHPDLLPRTEDYAPARPTCQTSKVSSRRAGGSIVPPSITAAPWLPRMYAPGMGVPLALVMNTSRSRVVGSRTLRSPEEGGGSATRPTALSTRGCREHRVESTNPGSFVATVLAWARARRWTCGHFERRS